MKELSRITPFSLIIKIKKAPTAVARRGFLFEKEGSVYPPVSCRNTLIWLSQSCV